MPFVSRSSLTVDALPNTKRLDVFYTWRARLVAIPIICGLVGLIWLDHLLFDSTRLADVIATLLDVGLAFCACVLVLGRLNNDAN